MSAWQNVCAPLTRLAIDNVDTDQIIPARFLSTTERKGLGAHCFADWRGANRKPGFELDRLPSEHRQIILAGHNFGCGSSREHAPWALLDFGVRVIIATQIADIFKSNALKNGLLPIVVGPAQFQQLEAHVGQLLEVDLAQLCLRAGGLQIEFSIDAFARTCLLEGLDAMGYLLARLPHIEAYERARV
jgi:3-isopropylmalate/(R)-2-methylmalate dehydratase small subunit